MSQDIARFFRIEAREILEELTRGLLDLEHSPERVEILDRCFRLAHTLKGAAHVAGQRRIGEMAHAVEDALAPYREGAEQPGNDHVSDVLLLVDDLRGEVAALERAAAPGVARPGAAGSGEEGLETVRVEIAAMDALLQGVSEAIVQLNPMRQGAEALRQAHRAAMSLVRGRAACAPRLDGGMGLDTIASELDVLDAALARAQREIGAGIERLERELAEVHSKASALRLVPVSTIFGALELAARDAARSLGKQVELQASGGDVRLEAHILAAVRDALLHLVRNAIAHGIEPESERMQAGKLPVGQLRIEVERRGRRAVFRCVDDGQGMDVDGLRHAAVRQHVMTAAEAAALSREDALQLALRAGVSTSAAVTELSGRGVGLDVARAAAARFDGDLVISSAPGRGTTIALDLALSLSSLSALAMLVDTQVALIPLDAVRSVLRVEAADVHKGGRGDFILFEGQSVPFAPLATLLDASRAPAPSTRSKWCIVVVRSADRLAALGLDRLLGTMEVTVKPLPLSAGTVALVAGAALDAHGDPLLVLDPRGVMQAVRAAPAPANANPEPAAASRTLPILVVDDSLTTRMLEQSILEGAGYEVDLAGSGEEALTKAAARRYGLFIVDVEMPGMSGIEFTQTARADPALRAVPVIIVTSLASAADRQRGAAAGAAAYIVKGEFDQKRFVSTVGRLVG